MRSFQIICSLVFISGCFTAFGMEEPKASDVNVSEGEQYFKMAEEEINKHRTEALQYYELAYQYWGFFRRKPYAAFGIEIRRLF